jgi:hypothetical protein
MVHPSKATHPSPASHQAVIRYDATPLRQRRRRVDPDHWVDWPGVPEPIAGATGRSPPGVAINGPSSRVRPNGVPSPRARMERCPVTHTGVGRSCDRRTGSQNQSPAHSGWLSNDWPRNLPASGSWSVDQGQHTPIPQVGERNTAARDGAAQRAGKVDATARDTCWGTAGTDSVQGWLCRTAPIGSAPRSVNFC